MGLQRAGQDLVTEQQQHWFINCSIFNIAVSQGIWRLRKMREMGENIVGGVARTHTFIKLAILYGHTF